MSGPLPAGATIGILGGGQLGRMLAMAAARLGYRSHVFDPAADPPAGQVADALTTALWEDEAALARFAARCAVVTYEFENIPLAALDVVERAAPLLPDRHALRVSADRLGEKSFLLGLGLQVAPHRAVPDLAALRATLKELGRPALLKTRWLGYDGKGQQRIGPGDDPAAAFAALQGAPAILEAMVPFEREISVIAARGLDGRVVAFDPGENLHEGGILRRTRVPARIPARLVQDAVLIAGRILNALDYRGVLGVELFVTPAGLLVNEFAPRVHNSGHWTQNGCCVDQFEQHIRAIAGWPLGDTRRHADVEMENLIGADLARVPQLAGESGVALHLYGKAEQRAGRKMGHLNRVWPPGTMP